MRLVIGRRLRRIGVAAWVTAVALALGGIACRKTEHVATAPPARETMAFAATAYSIEGKTAAGMHAHEGIVAADSKVLPLGTRIRVQGAGQYDGEYVVRDTGRAVKGREIDVYLASDREAKAFGRKNVQVEVVAWGDGRRARYGATSVRAVPLPAANSKTRYGCRMSGSATFRTRTPPGVTPRSLPQCAWPCTTRSAPA